MFSMFIYLGVTLEDIKSNNFDINSANYVNSDIHSKGKDLLDLSLFFSGKSDSLVLDVGSGSGHAAFAIAPSVKWVIACDKSESMLKNVTTGSKERNLTNIVTRTSSSENLVFDKSSFDFVVSRFSLHHWDSYNKALVEINRVLKQDGYFLLIDTISPENDLLETFINTVESLRDNSHIKSRKISELCTSLISSGFLVEKIETYDYNVDFEDWVTRKKTSNDYKKVLKNYISSASLPVLDNLGVKKNCDFTMKYTFIVAKKCE